MPTRVISIMNQKGGVGKTTTTLNLGAALAVKGKRVLLVDLDPQANLTHGLGHHAEDLSVSVYELLMNLHCDAASLVRPSGFERLDLIRSHIDLSGAEVEMVPMMGRETRLKRGVDALRERYDYILIDCLPSLSLLTINAMVASTELLVPLLAHPFSLEGLGKLFEIAGMLRETLNPELQVTGVLVTQFDSRTNVSQETLARLRGDERLAPHLFETIVRTNIKIAESQKDGIPVVHYDPSCTGAKAYMSVCEELIEMETGCVASQSRAQIRTRLGIPEPAAAEVEAPAPQPEAKAQAKNRAKAEAPAAEAAAEPVRTSEEREAALQRDVPGDALRERVADYGDPSFRPRLQLVNFETPAPRKNGSKGPPGATAAS